MLEFASSAMMPIIRIIEAMQNRPECGWAIFCKDSGSCWADTLLGPEDKCLPEAGVLKKLTTHADGAEDTTYWVIYATISMATVVVLCFLSAITKFIAKTLQGPAKPKGGEDIAEGEGVNDDPAPVEP